MLPKKITITMTRKFTQNLLPTFIMLMISLITQAQSITFNSTIPTHLEVCAESKTFTLDFNNVSEENLLGIEIQLDFPTGVEYISGSLEENSNFGIVESNTSNPHSISLSLNELPTEESISIDFDAIAVFSAYQAQLNGNVFNIDMTVNHNLGTDNDNTDPFNILYPALSITSIDPLTPEVFVGETMTREVTIANGGYGSLTSFVFIDSHDDNLRLDATSIGTLDQSKGEITFTSADFMQIGNNDGWLDNNEAITFTQTITAIGCESTQSTLTTFWGCDGNTVEGNIKYPFTTIELYAPNLSVTAEPAFNTCVDGTPDVQRLIITNEGSGPASGIALEIFPPEADLYTAIDPNTIRYSIDGNDYSLGTSNIEAAYGHPCFDPNFIGGFTTDVPTILPGETLIINWETYTCATNDCGAVNLAGWDYDLNYTDMCNSKNYNKQDTAFTLQEKDFTIFAETPSDLTEDEVGTYNFMLSSATFNLPEGDNPYFEAVFNIPNGLIWEEDEDNDLSFKSGSAVWEPGDVEYDEDTKTLTAQYEFPIPFNLIQSELAINLKADCTAGQSMVSPKMQLFYIMDTDCDNPYRLPLTCQEIPITQLHCPGVCEHGLKFESFAVQRTSFGEPDNDQDGLPDENGSFDEDKIKKNRVMTGDTFETSFKGTVATSSTIPSFKFGYAESAIPYGNHIQVESATIKVYDASTGNELICNEVPFTQSLNNGTRTVRYNFSVNKLKNLGCSDFDNFVFEDEDEIELIANYKVVGNVGGVVEQAMIQNSFYLSDTNNGTAYQCNDWNGNFTIVGYYYTTASTEQYNIRNCSQIISQNYYMSIGNCCSNYSGGDLFPYEYRNWSIVKDLKVEIPEGYEVGDMYMEQWRTNASNARIKETASITPTTTFEQTYSFDLENYLVENGGTINPSDDGFNGTIHIEVMPSCDLEVGVNNHVNWTFNFKENQILGGATTEDYTINPDRLKYLRSKLETTTNQPTVDGVSSTVTWDVRVRSRIAPSNFAWMHFVSNNNDIEVLEVYSLSENETLEKENGLFKMNNFNQGQSRRYRITASYNSCNLSNVKLYTGYHCEGYPNSMDDFPCEIQELDLFVEPLESELQVKFSARTNPIDECDSTIGIELELLSAQIGAVEEIELLVQTTDSENLTIESGSFEVAYPDVSNFTTISDPILDGDSYTITGADLHTSIGEDGLTGISDISTNKVKIKFNALMGEEFVPGDIINLFVTGKRPCGDDLAEFVLSFDPNAVFEETEGIGLDDINDSWAATWADVDGDGNVDLFVTTYDQNQANILYMNQGDGTFQKETSGVLVNDEASSLAATWADYDNDGDLDVYIANNIGTANALYRNDGTGNFTKIQNDPIVTDLGYGHGVSWVDYDNDGFVDMFVTDYFSTKFNQLYKNNGDGTFKKITTAAPVLEASYSVSAAWGDYDNDGFVDLFISNTENSNNSLYKNNGNGSFLKINQGAIVNDGGSSVGASWGDYDNDGDLDLFVANSGNQNNFLYHNLGNGTFTKVTNHTITDDTGHSHGSAWGDFDNDGDLDLFVGNNQGQDNFLYTNNGDGSFSKNINRIGDHEGESFGAAWGDYDNDGDIDLFVANHNQNSNYVYTNGRGSCQSNISITLVGTNSNKSGVGAKICVKADINGESVWQTREVSGQTGGGVGGQNEYKQIFGLLDAAIIDSIVIKWPSGYVQVVTDELPYQHLTIQEEDASELCGIVYYDENGNCIQDADEPGISNVQLIIQPENRTIMTGADGSYNTFLKLGDYTIAQVDNNSNWGASCSSELSLTIDQVGIQYCGNDLAVEPSCTLPDLKIDISTTAHRIGFENLIAITYSNHGGADATDVSLAVDFGSDITPLESSLPWTSESGNSRQWEFNTIPLGEAVTIYVKDFVSLEAVAGEDITVRGTIKSSEADCNGDDNTVDNVQIAEGAIDPNDILVSPAGYIHEEQELSYKIRFQNVGNAAVSTVIIEDKLPLNLDVSTLELGAASHTFRFTVEDGNRLVWVFDNINMPDSLTNEVESHGFVTYKIKPSSVIEDGDIIENQAAIYFDNNDPIITNIVTNIIGTPGGDLAEAGQLHVYPNPMVDDSTIEIISEDRSNIRIRAVYIYDMLGSELSSDIGMSVPVYQLERKSLNTGFYIVRATGENGKEYTSKILVK